MSDEHPSQENVVPAHPGRRLRQLLDAKRLSQEALADIIGCRRQTISTIVNEKSGITPDMAVNLATVFGNDPTEWLKWDAEFQLSLVHDDDRATIERRAGLYELAPIRDMQKRGWIRETSDLDQLQSELEKFFGGPLGDVSFTVAPKRSSSLDALTPAERAWCFRARGLSDALPLPAVFDPQRLDAAEKKLRQLAAYPKEIQRLPQMLAYYGIRFIIVEPLPGAKIDGAAFWHKDHPVIAVSARFDRIDALWFTVIHEFMHIKNADDISVDVDLLKESDAGIVLNITSEDAEQRANEQAAELLVPQAELDSFISRVSPLYATTRIIQFAHRIRIHPGIIVGQLQHRGELRYSAHRDLLVKVRTLVTETALTDGWGFSSITV